MTSSNRNARVRTALLGVAATAVALAAMLSLSVLVPREEDRSAPPTTGDGAGKVMLPSGPIDSVPDGYEEPTEPTPINCWRIAALDGCETVSGRVGWVPGDVFIRLGDGTVWLGQAVPFTAETVGGDVEVSFVDGAVEVSGPITPSTVEALDPTEAADAGMRQVG